MRIILLMWCVAIVNQYVLIGVVLVLFFQLERYLQLVSILTVHCVAIDGVAFNKSMYRVMKVCLHHDEYEPLLIKKKLESSAGLYSQNILMHGFFFCAKLMCWLPRS
jgi:hypothetical protein